MVVLQRTGNDLDRVDEHRNLGLMPARNMPYGAEGGRNEESEDDNNDNDDPLEERGGMEGRNYGGDTTAKGSVSTGVSGGTSTGVSSDKSGTERF